MPSMRISYHEEAYESAGNAVRAMAGWGVRATLRNGETFDAFVGDVIVNDVTGYEYVELRVMDENSNETGEVRTVGLYGDLRDLMVY